MGEEDGVTLTGGCDTNIEFGMRWVRKERFNNEVGKNSSCFFNLECIKIFYLKKNQKWISTFYSINLISRSREVIIAKIEIENTAGRVSKEERGRKTQY